VFGEAVSLDADSEAEEVSEQTAVPVTAVTAVLVVRVVVIVVVVLLVVVTTVRRCPGLCPGEWLEVSHGPYPPSDRRWP